MARAWTDKDRLRQRARMGRKRADARALIHQAKDRPCADCGRRYPVCVMTFDHVDGKKEFEISRWVAQHALRNLGRLLDEIAKCDVVCSNCHALREHCRSHEGLCTAVEGADNLYQRGEEDSPELNR